jgi:hypothetical protein
MSGLAIAAGCPVTALPGRTLSLACPATLSAPSSLPGPIQVTAVQVAAGGGVGAEMWQWVLWPGQPGVPLPAPDAGSVWLVSWIPVAELNLANDAWWAAGLVLLGLGAGLFGYALAERRGHRRVWTYGG